MPCKILTPDVTSIDALLHDHQTVLAKSEAGAVAVFANNAPAFYALTPARLAQLLASAMQEPDRLTEMAGAARTAGKPDATRLLADLVESIAAGKDIAHVKGANS